jgi:acetyl-CoA carboxylase carboxyl transferase subunit alpha
MMLQNNTYSVISPEGCATILWKSAEKAPDAAESLGITAPRLKELGLIDEIIPEPLGGAHSNYAAISESLGKTLAAALQQIKQYSKDELLERRYQRLMNYGEFSG